MTYKVLVRPLPQTYWTQANLRKIT